MKLKAYKQELNKSYSSHEGVDNIKGTLTPSELYKVLYGVTPEVTRLSGAGGDRSYFRLFSADGPEVIGTTGPDVRENKSFVNLSCLFRARGINVPEIFIADEHCASYLQSDLGDVSLLSLLSTERRMELSKSSLSQLVKMQSLNENEWLPYVYSLPFSKRMVMWDLNYFKYEFVKPCAVIFDEDKLEDDFENLSVKLSHYDPSLWGFMYRDFQSRNIIIKEGEPFFIDYQGGRKGPGLYDAVSFLWQAKAAFTKDERLELLEWYASAYAGIRNIEKGHILANVGLMALLRTLQVLGAYGFRGLVEKRAHFIESIPGALANLMQLLNEGAIDNYPELKNISEQLVENRYSSREKSDTLIIKVFSFSYKKGYPEDLSGNGGGFMFDCRGMHNPGRYDCYKPLTGLDKEVIDFLEEKGEVQLFLDNAYQMVAPTVGRYLQRGFNSLQIGFGCTGGHHRSVYCAQHFAERLALAFPDARIELIHREQGIKKVFNVSNIEV